MAPGLCVLGLTMIFGLAFPTAAQELHIKPREPIKTVWEGTSQQLECKVFLNVESPDLSWSFTPPNASFATTKSTTTETDGSFTSLRMLTITSFKESDAGNYICSLKGSESYSATEATVRLKYQPRCHPGRYGINCSFTCSKFCKPSEITESSCNYMDGTCLFGCKDDRSGPNCSKETQNSLEEGTKIGLGLGLGLGIPLVIAVIILIKCYIQQYGPGMENHKTENYELAKKFDPSEEPSLLTPDHNLVSVNKDDSQEQEVRRSSQSTDAGRDPLAAAVGSKSSALSSGTQCSIVPKVVCCSCCFSMRPDDNQLNYGECKKASTL